MAGKPGSIAVLRSAILGPLLLAFAMTVQAQDSRETWLMQTLRDDNPVREQLAMLSQPGHPLTLRVYRGKQLPCGRRARIQDGELALSEGLLDELHTLDAQPGNPIDSGRWSLLYVLAYLGAQSTQTSVLPEPQRRAQAMLTAANQVMASAWEEAGRPHRQGQRARLLGSVLNQIPYAQLLRTAPSRLRTDADGFVVDAHNVQALAALLARPGTPSVLE